MLDVQVFHSLPALAPWRSQLAKLHRSSPRQSPFTTLEFYEAYLAHDEFLQEGVDLQVWFLVAFEGGAPVGYLALRRTWERIGPLKAARLEFLATHDVVQPHVVSRPEDEARCVEAFYRELLARKADWSMLELKQQAPGAALFPPAGAGLQAHYVRTFEAATVSVIPNRFATLDGYLAALDKKFRANLKRQLRHLLAAGEVRFLYSADPDATPAMLDLYLDVERRSWKVRVAGTIGRDERRVAFFRRLLDPRMPFRVGIGLVLLGGLPIAGCISNEQAGTLHVPQVVFDDRFSKLTPGYLIFPLLMREVIEARGAGLNLMSGFASYKAKWGAQVTECRSVQLFHRGSLLFYKAIAGELRRALELRLRGPAAAVSGNVAKHATEDDAEVQDEGAGEVGADRRFVDALVSNLAGKQVRVTSATEIDTLFGLGITTAKAVVTRAS
ncbi:MAG TPA: GNAT family N-acetyltransferase [Myxococcales bacterium]